MLWSGAMQSQFIAYIVFAFVVVFVVSTVPALAQLSGTAADVGSGFSREALAGHENLFLDR